MLQIHLYLNKYFPQDLTHIRPEDVGYDLTVSSVRSGSCSRPVSGQERVQGAETGAEEDPLFSMLMTLQEAANTQAGDL